MLDIGFRHMPKGQSIANLDHRLWAILGFLPQELNFGRRRGWLLS